MSFDDDYKREVLEPARHAGDQPPENLLMRYRLRDPLSPGDIAVQVKQVRQCWRRARGQLKYRRLIDRLEAEHRELAPIFTAAERGDIGPLMARLRSGAERTARRRAEARTRLLDAAGPLRLLTPGDVEGIARSTGITPDELRQLLRSDRIEIRQPDPLPATAPYRGYMRARESLTVLGHRHLADFLFGRRLTGPMRVLDGFHAPGVRLDAAAVTAVTAQWARRPRDTSSTNADTVLAALRSALRQPPETGEDAEGTNGGTNGGTNDAGTNDAGRSDAGTGEGTSRGRGKGTSERTSDNGTDGSARLAALVRYDLVDRLRERHRQRASDRALLRYAVDGLGIEPGDARRLVFSVLREGSPAGGLAGRLRELLNAGAAHAAALLADAVLPGATGGETDTGTDAGTTAGGGSTHTGTGQDFGATVRTGDEAWYRSEAGMLAAEARERVTTAIRMRDEAIRCPDPDHAWRLLTDALHLVRDLPGAEEHRRRLPPLPPGTPVAVVDSGGTGVRLSWAESASKEGDIGYRVVRRRGGPPRDGMDGETLPSEGTGAHDDRPPVNVPLFYAVIAWRGDAAAAPAVAGPVVVRPEPAQVRLAAGDGMVTGRWRCPPAAARMLVTRSAAGATSPPIPVEADRESFRDLVPNGKTYHYHIRAVYLDDSGREVTTPGVRLSATPSAPPAPVGGFTVEPDPGRTGRLLIGFAAPDAGAVEMFLLPGPPPWPEGGVVPLTEVRRVGRLLAAEPTPGGLAVHPEGSGILLAVTVIGASAAIGAHRRHVDLPPPRRLSAQRLGTTVRVGFDWPSDVSEVELTYRIGDSQPCRTSITRAAYDAQGGIRLTASETEQVDVLVASSGLHGDTRLVGTPVRTTVAGGTPVSYDLARTGPPWRRTVAVTLGCSESVRLPRLVLVLRAGRVLPQHPDDGDTIASWEDLAVPAQLSVPLARRTGPFWLRCFATDGVIELTDPPVRRLRMKG